MKRRLTDQEQRAAAALYREGYSTPQIASALGVVRFTVARALRREGVELRPKGRPLITVADGELHEMAQRYRAGVVMSELAEERGVSRDVIRRWLLEAGVRMRPRGAASHRRSLKDPARGGSALLGELEPKRLRDSESLIAGGDA